MLSGLMFLEYLTFGMWLVTMGTYLLQTLQFSGWQVGMVYSTTALGALLSPFLTGLLTDRYFSAERVMSVLHVLSGLLMLLMTQLQRFELFFPAIFLYTLLFMPTISLSSALSFHHIEDAKRDFPRVRVWGTISWIIAGLFLGALDWEPTVWPLYASTVASGVTAVFCLYLPSTPPHELAGKKTILALLRSDLLPLFRRPSFLVLMIALTLICIPSAFYYSFVNPFLVETGFSNAAAWMSMGQAAELLLMLGLPFILRRFAMRGILFFGLAAWGLRYLCFAYAVTIPALAYLGILLHGAAYVYTALTAQIYVDQIVPNHLRSTAQGFISLVTLGLGALFGSWFAGWIVGLYTQGPATHDWWSIWMVPGIIGLGTAVLFVLFFRARQRVE